MNVVFGQMKIYHKVVMSRQTFNGSSLLRTLSPDMGQTHPAHSFLKHSDCKYRRRHAGLPCQIGLPYFDG
jgi:hypothetical protein